MPEVTNMDPTRRNYEEADTWHSEKSESYNWGSQRDLFIARLTGGGRILDVGAGGSGRDIQNFKSQGFAVEGLDYSAAAVSSLRQQFPDLKFYEADMRATGLPNAAYKGIWACASLLNIPKSDVPTALAEFHRLLEDGGELFISVKEGAGEKMVPDKAGERFFSFFSPNELSALVKAAGFNVWKVEVLEDSWFTGNEIEPKPPAWICLHAVK